MDEELLSTHLQELRRGTVVLACLLILEEPNYGYALLEVLEQGVAGPWLVGERSEKRVAERHLICNS